MIALLWSKQLIDAAGGIIGRAGPIVGLVWVLLIAAASWRWSRTSADGAGGHAMASRQFLNRGAALLVIATVGYGLISGRLPGARRRPAPGHDARRMGRAESDSAAGSPDMYVILLDGYPRADVLDYAFDIDNSAFLDALAERGFTVAAELAQRLPVDPRQRLLGR